MPATTMCGVGGTGEPKPNVAGTVRYTSGLIAAIFAAYDLAWLIPIIPLLSEPSIILSDFCANDPPAIPTMSAAEVNALLQMDVTDPNYISGLPKFKDLALHFIWPDVCQCATGTYIPPTPPTPPAGANITQYQIVNSGGPCRTGDPGTGADVLGSTDCQDTHRWEFRDASSNTIGTPYRYLVSEGQTKTDFIAVPANAHDLALWIDSAGTCGSLFRGGPLLSDLANPTGVQITMSETYVSATNTMQRRDSWAIYCGNETPNSQVSQCCPTDPATLATLNAIYNMVQLLQRQVAPFSYVVGNLHGGLTLTGEISIQGLLGAKVDFPFGVPSHFSEIVGDPTTYLMDSWISWGNADGWTAREFLTATPYLSFPPFPGQYTKIGYSLAPGVRANIYELLREP